MKLAGELVGIAYDNNVLCRIATQQPRWVSDRDADRFQRTRWLVNQEPSVLTRIDSHQLVNDGVDVPVREIRCARQNGAEDLPDEVAQIGSQQRRKGRVHFGSSLSSRRDLVSSLAVSALISSSYASRMASSSLELLLPSSGSAAKPPYRAA